MIFVDNDTFDYECYCKLCGSDDVEFVFDEDECAIIVKCNHCLNTDKIVLQE